MHARLGGGRDDAGPSVAHGPAPARQDLDLLRAYEPVIRYTRGELFLPTAVGPYVARCGLWAGTDTGAATRLVAPGGLTLERLCAESRAHEARPLSLRFVEEPLGRAELRRWRRTPREHLDAGGRFTTTGVLGRIADAGFRASLLLRGTVASGLAAAAEVAYREHLEADRCTYYGRVVRDGGYVCLQYWFFYAMNDWRSSFAGVNDHEADWEAVVVYLAARPGTAPRPAWVASSSHDHRGAELRRRWDDPELRRVGDHPVVFAGAGSHAGAFAPGDYVVSVDPPALRRLLDVAHRTRRLLAPWRDATSPAAGFGIPFVDYKRGDGVTVGPGGDRGWTAVTIDDDTPWVRDFRGLWGLDTEDRFGGERAPAGPRYERGGALRAAWTDPLGWAGLLEAPASDDADSALLSERVDTLEREMARLDETIAGERRALRALRAEVRSLRSHDATRALAARREAEAGEREAQLGRAHAERTRLAEEHRAHVDTLSRPEPLAAEAPRAHLTAAARGPRVEEEQRRTRFLRLWSVVSTPLLLAAIIVVLNARPLTWIATILVLCVVFAGVEAFARRRLVSFLASLVLVAGALLAGSTFLLLFREHWRLALSAVLGAAALALLVGNLGDLRHGWRRGPTA